MLDENIDQKLKHIAFIMDGNGRWAKEKGLSRSSGHYAGVRRVKPIAEEVFLNTIYQRCLFLCSQLKIGIDLKKK